MSIFMINNRTNKLSKQLKRRIDEKKEQQQYKVTTIM